DTRRVVSLALAKLRFSRTPKILPALRPRQIGVRGRFRYKDQRKLMLRKIGRLRDGAPEGELGDQHFGLRVGQKLELFVSSEFVVERDQHAAGEKNRIGGNQPLRLIGHDDGSAAGRGETGVLQSSRERESRVTELTKRQAQG